MYLFISENEIQKYNGEVLKRFIGKRLVKVIANPTDEQLKEFGYMELAESEIPEYNMETQYIKTTYSVADGKIMQMHTVEDIAEPHTEEGVEA